MQDELPDVIELPFTGLNDSVSHEFLKEIIFIGMGGPPRRSLIISAHPDDEVTGAGAYITKLKNTELYILEVTDGAPRDMEDAKREGFSSWIAYARARKEELWCALIKAGIRSPGIIWLDYPDKEALLNLPAISKKIMNCLRELRPDVIFTLPYEGGHPDHDATAFAVHAALKLLPANYPRPWLIEYASYSAGGNGGIRFDFRPVPNYHPVLVPLRLEETALKEQMIRCFKTQRSVLQIFPLDIERFRPAPSYDFTCAPHKGKLYYENFNWGATGEDWRALARKALRELGISGPM